MKKIGALAGFMLAGGLAMSPLAIAQPVSPLTYVQPLSGSALKAVQQRLRDLGVYGGIPDGVWGRDSQSALMRFQQNKGLQATGHLNTSTLATLGLNAADMLELPVAVVAPMAPMVPAVAVAPANAVIPLGADTIRLVQGRLQQLGFVSTPADGIWGPSTQAGIESMQRARGLPATGQLNAATMSSMGLDPGALVQGH